MKYFLPITSVILLMASCTPSGEHVNSWDRQSSALDPVGVSTLKQQARAQAEQAKFKPGTSVTFSNPKIAVCSSNPETSFSASTKMKTANDAKVLLCGNYYAKVQFPDGDMGYVNLNEIIDPNQQFASEDLPVGLGADENMPAFLNAAEEATDIKTDNPTDTTQPVTEDLPQGL